MHNQRRRVGEQFPVYLENSARAKGYQTTLNIMAVSHATDRELTETLQRIGEETRVSACYIVDSFGSFHVEDIDRYFDLFKRQLNGVPIGIHCHNQQQLAFSNTIHGIRKGAAYLDATLYGLGRAAGNCPMELLIGFLNKPELDIRPLLNVIGKEILPLRKNMSWGYSIPYMLAGVYNQHPKAALEHMALPEDHPEKHDFTGFFERITKALPPESPGRGEFGSAVEELLRKPSNLTGVSGLGAPCTRNI